MSDVADEVLCAYVVMCLDEGKEAARSPALRPVPRRWGSAQAYKQHAYVAPQVAQGS